MFRKQMIAVVTACAVSMGVIVASVPAQASAYDPVQFQNEFTTLVNTERAKMQRAPLVTSSKLYDRSKNHVEVDWVAAGGPFHYTTDQMNAMMKADQCTGFWAEIYSPAATTPQDLLARYKNSNTHWNALMEPRLRQIGSFSSSTAGNSTRMSQGCAGNEYPSQDLGIFHETISNGKKEAFSTEGYTAYYTGPQSNQAVDPRGNVHTNSQASGSGENIMGFEIPRYNGTYNFTAQGIPGVKTPATGQVTLDDVGTTFITPATDNTNVELKPLEIPVTVYPYHDRAITTEFSKDNGNSWAPIEDFGTIQLLDEPSTDNGYSATMKAVITPHEYRRGIVQFRFSTESTSWSNAGQSNVLSYNFGGGITVDSVISVVGDSEISIIPNEEPSYNFTATDAGYRTWVLYESRNGGENAVAIGEADGDGNIAVTIPLSNLNQGIGKYTYYLELPAEHGQRAVRSQELIVNVIPIPTIMTWGDGKDITTPIGADWADTFGTATIDVQGNNSPDGRWTLEEARDGREYSTIAQGNVNRQGNFNDLANAVNNIQVYDTGLYAYRLTYTPQSDSEYVTKSLERSVQVTKAPVAFSFSEEWADVTLDEDVPFTSLVEVTSPFDDMVQVILQESLDGGKTWAQVWSTWTMTNSGELGFSASRTGSQERQYRVFVPDGFNTLEAYSDVVTVKAPKPLPSPTLVGWTGGTIDRDEGIIETIPLTLSHPGVFQQYDFGTGEWVTITELPVGTTAVDLVSAQDGKRLDYRVFIPGIPDELRAFESEHLTYIGWAPAVVPEVTSVSLYIGATYAFTADLPRDGILQVSENGEWVDVEEVVDGQRVSIDAATKPMTKSYRFFVPGNVNRVPVESPVFTVETILIETIVETPQDAGLTYGDTYKFNVNLTRDGVLQQETATGWVDQYALTDGQEVTISALEESGTEVYRIFVPGTDTHAPGYSANFTVETNVKYTIVETPRSETIKIGESHTFTVNLPRDGILYRLVDGLYEEVSPLVDGQEVTINALDKAGIDAYQIYVPRHNEYLAGWSDQFFVWTELYETVIDSTNLTDKTVNAGQNASYTVDMPRDGILQAIEDGRWVDIQPVNAQGEFVITTDRAGIVTYRVFIPASETHLSARSNEFKVTAKINATIVNTPESKVLVLGDKYEFNTNVERLAELQVKTNEGWVKSQNVLPDTQVTIQSNDLLTTLEYRIFVPGTLTHAEAYTDVFTVRTLDNSIIVETPKSVTVNAGDSVTFTAKTVRNGELQERVNGEWVKVQDVAHNQEVTISAKPTEQSAVYRLYVPADGFYLEGKSGQFTVTTVKQNTNLETPLGGTVAVDTKFSITPVMDRDGVLERLVENEWVTVQEATNGAPITLDTSNVGTFTYRINILETSTHNGATSGSFTLTVELNKTVVITPESVQRYTGDSHDFTVTLPRDGELQELVDGDWVTVRNVKNNDVVTLEPTFDVGIVTYRVFIPETRTHEAGVSGNFMVSTALRITNAIPQIDSVERYITQDYVFDIPMDRDGIVQKHVDGDWVNFGPITDGESVTIPAGDTPNTSTYRVIIEATQTHTGVQGNEFTITTTVGVTNVPTPASVEILVGDTYDLIVDLPRSGSLEIEKNGEWEHVYYVKNGDRVTIHSGPKGEVRKFRLVVPASATHSSGASKAFTTTSILRETQVSTPDSGRILVGESFDVLVDIPRDGKLQKDTGLGWDDVQDVSNGDVVTLLGDTAGTERYRLFVPENETHAQGTSGIIILEVKRHTTTLETPQSKELKGGESYTFTVQSSRSGFLQVKQGNEWLDVREVQDGDKVTIKSTPQNGTESYRIYIPETDTHNGAVSGTFTVKTTIADKPVPPGKDKPNKPGKPDKDKPNKPGKPDKDKDKPNKPGKPDKNKPNKGKKNNGKGNKNGSKYDGRHDTKVTNGKGNSKDKDNSHKDDSKNGHKPKKIAEPKAYTFWNKHNANAYVQKFTKGKWQNVMTLKQGSKVTITSPESGDVSFRLYYPKGN